MDITDTRFFLQVQRGIEGRLLYPVTMLSSAHGAYTVKLNPGEEELPIETGLEVFVYYYVRHQFMQQLARVREIEEERSEEGRAFTIRLEVEGQPYLAESRECFRVSGVNSHIRIEVGEGEACPLIDISAKGLTFTSSTTYPVGSMISVSMVHEGKVFCGKGRIQSARILEHGRLRYGLQCPEGTITPGSLAEGLQVIAMALQREHLSHLARTK